MPSQIVIKGGVVRGNSIGLFSTGGNGIYPPVPPAPAAPTYLRPGGVDGYRRPGGTDLYLRP